MIEKLKNIFQFIVGIATIISCGAAIVGVMQVVSFVVEVRPVVNEFQRLIDTVRISYRDTVLIPKEVIKSDTVIVFHHDTVVNYKNRVKPDEPETKVPSEGKKSISQNEEDFRNKHRKFFGGTNNTAISDTV